MINPISNNNDRVQQRQTIHEMVEKSVASNFHAAEESTGENSHHNEHRKIEAWTSEEALFTAEQLIGTADPESDNGQNENPTI